MLIRGTPSILTPPSNPLGFSGLSLSGSLGYVDSETPRTGYTTPTTDWDIFQDNLFFGDRSTKNDPAHPANIFGSYYDPRVWGAGGVAQQKRDLISHWKRVLSQFPGATWNDIAIAYQVPQSTILQFAQDANANILPAIRAIWQNPILPDSIKRPALGLIVQRLGLSPWEWAGVVGLDEVTAAQIVAVPVPKVAATSFAGVMPAVQATPTSPGYVVETRTGEVAVIPAGSEPFIDAGFTNDASGRRLAVLNYAAPGGGTELFFIDPKAAPLDRPIAPSKLGQLRELLNLVQRGAGERARNITSNETANFDRYLSQAAALVNELGFTESELAQFLGMSLDQFRAVYVFDAAGFGIKETRQTVIVPSELPEFTMSSEQALEPVQLVFYFDFPVGFADAPAAQKASFYLSKIDAGFTDAQIRITAESAFGPQADADWGALRNLAAAQRAAEIAAKAAADAAAAAAGSQDMQAVTVAVTANDAAQAAATAAANAADAAAAGDTAGVASATTIAITASDTAINAGNELSPKVAAYIYKRLIEQGYSDEQIRKNFDQTYGFQTDEDWALLRSTAADLDKPVRKTPPFDPNDPGWVMSANIYNKKREQGLTDAAIRVQIAAKGTEVSDDEWSRFTAFAQSLQAATSANVTQAYRDILKRAPDAAGLEFYTTGGFTIDQVIADMKASPEYKALSTATPAAGGGVAPLLLAVATAYFLGA